MTQPLVSVGVTAPGFRGLNKQQSAGILDPSWATTATNCVIDNDGKITSRKGWQAYNRTNLPSDVLQIAEANGRYFYATRDRLYTDRRLPIDVTGDLEPTNGNWKFQVLRGTVYGWQRDHHPIVWNEDEQVFEELEASSGSGPIPMGNSCLAAGGRIWASDSTEKEVWYSDLLLPNTWYNAEDPTTSGSAGLIDLNAVWVYEDDDIVSLETFNNFLVVFGRKTIVIYSGIDNPDNLALQEVIRGTGCLARDSVQNTGEDIIFLSNGGLRSLQRLVMEKSLPFTDESAHVRDHLMSMAADSNRDEIRSVYSAREGFYLLSLPRSGRLLCFDMRTRLEDGSRRVTEWTDLVPTALYESRDQTIVLGQSRRIGRYEGYSDNGNTYRLRYQSGWIKLSEQEYQFILKRIRHLVHCDTALVYNVEWAFDYMGLPKTAQVQLFGESNAEFGVAEFGISEFSGGQISLQASVPGRGSGRVIRFGANVRIVGRPVSIQEIQLQAKRGRMG